MKLNKQHLWANLLLLSFVQDFDCLTVFRGRQVTGRNRRGHDTQCLQLVATIDIYNYIYIYIYNNLYVYGSNQPRAAIASETEQVREWRGVRHAHEAGQV